MNIPPTGTDDRPLPLCHDEVDKREQDFLVRQVIRVLLEKCHGYRENVAVTRFSRMGLCSKLNQALPGYLSLVRRHALSLILFVVCIPDSHNVSIAILFVMESCIRRNIP